MKLVVDWGALSPRVDRLLVAECSHCDGPAGRLIRHGARAGWTKAWLACCILSMGRSLMLLLVLVVVAARLFATDA